MRVLVVQESMFGNTADVARAVAGALAEHADVRLVAAAEAPADPGNDLDLLVVGAPTHGLTLPTPRSRDEAIRHGAPPPAPFGVREWLDALPAGQAWPVATFCTKVRRGGPFAGSAAKAAARVARRHGHPVLASADFFVSATPGPLLPGELARAAAWAGGLVPVAV